MSQHGRLAARDVRGTDRGIDPNRAVLNCVYDALGPTDTTRGGRGVFTSSRTDAHTRTTHTAPPRVRAAPRIPRER